MSEGKPEEVNTQQELEAQEVLQEKTEEEGKEEVQQEEATTEEGAVEARLQQEIDDLRASLEEARREAAENYEKFLRTLADLDNFRRRTRMEYEEVVANANRELMASLLPIVDNFERALAAAEQTKNFEAITRIIK
jgi:molecular chaperone GrpE